MMRERLVEHAREHVARPHAAARQTQDLVELPARGVDLERQPLGEPVVFVPGDVEVFAVVGEHRACLSLSAASGKKAKPRGAHARGVAASGWNGWRNRMVCSRSGPVETMSIGAPMKRLHALEIAAGVERQRVPLGGAEGALRSSPAALS